MARLVVFGSLMFMAARSEAFELHEAAGMGDVMRIRMLVEAGMPVAALDDQKLTPLHVAAAEGHVEAVRALVEAGAPLEARDFAEQTPLHLAALFGHTECVRLLLAAGADKGAKDFPGQTPLALARKRERPQKSGNGHTEIIALLE